MMRLLDAAFGHPRGALGRLGAALMVRGNVEQETWAVEHAGLHARSRVLMVGHGPGVGLVQAAAAVTPGGHVTGVDPSPLMRELAAVRCAEQIAAGVIELRKGTAENTGTGIGVHTPIKDRHLAIDNTSYNTLLSAVRALGERANAELRSARSAYAASACAPAQQRYRRCRHRALHTPTRKLLRKPHYMSKTSMDSSAPSDHYSDRRNVNDRNSVPDGQDELFAHLLWLGEPMRYQLLAVVVVAATGLAACTSSSTPSQQAGTSDANAVVTVAAGEDTWPVQGTGDKSTTFAYPLNVNVYEPLVRLASDYTLQPGLATSWEFQAPKTWRFHLRHSVKFQDGHPFTADDVVWTWGVRQVKGQTLSTVSSGLTPGSVKKVDDFTVDFTTTVPNLRLPEQIVHPEGAIVEQGKDFDSKPPAGTGPFKVVSYRPGQSADLVRFDDYWGQKAKVKEMKYQFIPDPQTRIQALKAGTVDFVIDIPPESAASLVADNQFHVVRSKAGRNQLIYVNKLGEAPFDLGADPAVRQAVSLAIDRKTYADVALQGNADPGRWMAPKSVLGSSADEVAAVPFDATRAKSVLTADGWKQGSDGIFAKNGRPLKLTIIGWAEITDAAFQVIQSQLKDVGIDLTIKKAADSPTYNNYYKSSQWDLDLEVPNQNDGNPAFLPVLRMYSKNTNTQRFAPGQAFDALAEQAAAAGTVPEVQKASADMMKELINEDYIVIPMAGIYRLYGTKAGVDLGDPHPSQTNQIWTSLTRS